MPLGLEGFDRLRLAELPTPIRSLPRLTGHLGGPRLFVKRDDLTGLGLGGNKVRKLEYVLAEARRLGADTLVSIAVLQSNALRQTAAAAAARLGLRLHAAVTTDRVARTSLEYTRGGNYLLTRMFGAHLIESSIQEDSAEVTASTVL